MNKIQEFFSEQFGTIRTVNLDGVIYFYGIDIAKALGYSNASKAVTTHCKRIVTKVLETSNSQNGKTVKGKVSLISKSDIYRLIVKSKLESADQFGYLMKSYRELNQLVLILKKVEKRKWFRNIFHHSQKKLRQ